MKKVPFSDVVGIGGMILTAVGVGMIYRPAGVIVAGLLLVSLALFGFKPAK